MQDKWANNLKSRMDGYKQSVPDDLWKSVEKSLDDKAASRRARVVLLRWASAAACAAALALVAFFGFRSSFSKETSQPIAVVSQKALPEKAPAKAESTSEDAVAIVEKSNEKISAKASTEPLVARLSDNEPASPLLDNETVEASMSNETTAEQFNSKEPFEPAKAQASNQEDSSEIVAGQWEDYIKEGEMSDSKSESGISSLGLIAGSRVGQGRSSQNDRAFFSADVSPNDSNELPFVTTQGVDSFLSAPLTGLDKNYDHNIPVRFGLSIKYSLTDRLSLGSGLTYSFLKSSFTSDFFNTKAQGTQKMHYVGIPLNLNYNFLRKSSAVAIYAVAGGEVAKCFSGKLEADYKTDGTLVKSVSQSATVKPLQWSLTAAAGISLRLLKNISLYAEPGVAYYFDNGSSIKTYYNETPLNFSLMFGLSFNL
ncbi:MAG: outer membrane beta-barrel protein [Bacteroidales bacterium]